MPHIVPGTIQILSSSLPSDEAFQSTDFSVKVLGLSGTKDITEKKRDVRALWKITRRDIHERSSTFIVDANSFTSGFPH